MRPSEEAQLARVRELNAEFRTLTGRGVYGHATQPTPTTWRITFDTGVVCLSPEEAVLYMSGLLAVARHDGP